MEYVIIIVILSVIMIAIILKEHFRISQKRPKGNVKILYNGPVGLSICQKKQCLKGLQLKNEIILNVFKTFVPNRKVAICDSDTAWMSENIKK